MKMIKIPLSKYCTVIVGKDKPTDFSEEKNAKYQIPIYANGIENDGIVGYTNKALIQQEAVTVSARGNVGTAFYRSEPFVPIIRLLVILTDKQYIDTKYLYYVLKNMSIFGVGSIQKQLTRPDMEKKIISIFEDVEYQKRIAKILSRIDDKIYNNNKIISELESMAKTIYDYWFLQYEFPNEEGKPYKSSGGKMVYNEELKKEVPEGWTCKKIGDIEGNIVTGKTPSTKDEKNFGGTIPFITIDDIRQGLYISNTIRTLSEKGANLQVKKYIPEDSICVTCIATVGLVGITTQDSQTNQQINSIVCENKNNLYYLVNAIKDHFKYSSGAKTGNVFDNMNKEDFSSIKVVHPTENVLKMYKDKMQPLYDNIKSNILENQELTKLRDYLLPLLMNGQVSFKN